MSEVILASQSPRRKEILSLMGVNYQIIPSAFDEQLDDSRDPEDVAKELALGKAMDVAQQYPNHIVIGADTIVTVNGQQLEKPHDTEEAHAMLKQLSDTSNAVTTGVAVVILSQGAVLTAADTTRVFFRPYNEALVTQYIATGDPMDKAGAYGIQSGAAALISHIEGHYDTVVGLPTHLLSRLLNQVGIDCNPIELASPVEQVFPAAKN